MGSHVELRLHDGDALIRVVARLHGLRAGVAELHAVDSRACLHVNGGAPRDRVRALLRRLADVTVIDGPGECLASPSRPGEDLHRVAPVESVQAAEWRPSGCG